jgi:sugar phosphate isomerase/epimerase
MQNNLGEYAKIGLNHHCMYPCKDNPAIHAQTLPLIVNRDDIEAADITIPYGEQYRARSIEVVRSSGKTIIYNGYLMPTVKIPPTTFSFTERAQIYMLARDQADVACEAGAKYFMQSVGADPGIENRRKAFECLGEYIYEISSYIDAKRDMPFLIELMDRNLHKKSLCGPSEEVMEFVDRLSSKVPNIGVVLDVNHIVLMEETFEHAFTTCSKYLRHVHLGNCILKDRTHPWWGGTHPPIGIEGGEVDIADMSAIFRILLDTGYLNKAEPGTMCLEIRASPGKTEEETISDNLSRIYKAWEMV